MLTILSILRYILIEIVICNTLYIRWKSSKFSANIRNLIFSAFDRF